MSNCLILVQARMSSTRLPGKVMLEVCGKSLLELMVERLQRVSAAAGLAVVTTTSPDDDLIVEHCNSLGVAVFRGHPTDLLDRHYQAAVAFGAGVIAKIPSDCPLIDPSVIDLVLDRFAVGDCDYASNLHPASFPDGNDVEVMSLAALETAWHEASLEMEREHTTPYIWERPERFRLANVLWETGADAQPFRDYSLSHRWTLDYREDFEFIRRVYEELYPTNQTFGLNDILELLDVHPEIASINSSYAGVNWYRHHLDELKTVDARHTRHI